MIVSDDQGWTDFGFMGHPHIRTPRIDRLARDSAVFPNGYVPTSLCRASLATLLTGLYPHQHRICCNDPPEGAARTEMHPFIRNSPALPRLLGAAGYRSLQTGKFWEGHFSNAGFTHGETTNEDRHIARKRPQIGRDTMQPIYDFIDQSGTTPFFVWYAPMMPHTPHNPPEAILARYRAADRDIRVAKYWAMCEWFDQTCGQLLDRLDAKGLSDDTLVVFVVDNGWIQFTGERNPSRAQFETRSKLSPYDGGVRTPIILRWPNKVKRGVFDDLVSTIDLAPTMLDACGLKPPEPMRGLNLLRPATGQGPLQRDAVFGEIFQHTAAAVGKPGLSLTHRWVRNGEWKLIRFDRPAGPPELFNLAQDPHEARNLAPLHPQRVTALSQQIDQWWDGRDR